MISETGKERWLPQRTDDGIQKEIEMSMLNAPVA